MPKLSQAIGLLAVLLCPVVVLAGPPAVVGVQSVAPGVVDLLLSSSAIESAGSTVADVIDTSPASYRVDGIQPVGVSRYSVPYDETPADRTISPNRFTVTVRHHVYLRLGAPLQSGSAHTITSPYGSTSLTYTDTGTFCSAIKVNQGAYAGAATTRYSVFGVWLGDSGSTRFSPMPSYSVYAEGSGTLLLSGTASLEIDDTGTGVRSGEWTYRLPLTSLSTGGPYFISVPGCGRSRPFWIGGNAFRDVASTVFKGLYHQRCGVSLDAPYTQWTRPICSLTHRSMPDVRMPWSNDPITLPAGAPTIQVTGGYHDAGDFDRRPQHIVIPIELLSHAEAFPQNFTDGQYNLPESWNGIPDVLDEALFGVRSWEILQVTAAGDPKLGGVRSGTGEIRDTTYGVDYASNDSVLYGTWDVDGPAGTAAEGITAFAAGMFAHASRLVRPYDAARADALLNKATLAWAYVARTYDLSATKTYLMYGALQMYLATGQQSFHDLFKRQVQAIVTVQPGGGQWPEQWQSSNLAASCRAVHFVSYVLPQSQPVDATIVSAIKSRIIAEADGGGYYGLHPERTAYPILAGWALDWGSTNAIRDDAPMFAWLVTTDPAKRQGYYNDVSLMADHVLGLNALGRPGITGIGTDRLVSPLHLDSYMTEQRGLGPVPGITLYFVTGGRSGQGFEQVVTNKLSPGWDSLPAMRRWGDGWSAVHENEFSTHESIIWNAVAFAFLSGPATSPPPLDAGTDASLADSATDAVADTSVDARSDTGSVTATDASLADSVADSARDVVPDTMVAPVDSGAGDSGVDASPDSGIICIEVTAPVCWRPMSMSR